MKKVENPSKIGLKRSIVQAITIPRSLTEIADFIKKKEAEKLTQYFEQPSKPPSKSNILHHLGKMVALNYVQKDSNKRYLLKVADTIQNSILEELRKEATLDELFIRLRKKSEEVKKSNNELKKLVEKNDKVSLGLLLEFFYSQNLINLSTKKHITTKTKEVWFLSWLGCSKINACIVCKDFIDPKETSVIANTIGYGENPRLGSDHVVLIHHKCFRRMQESPWEESFDYCEHCGLPLSKKRLFDWIFREDSRTILAFIKKYFSEKETALFNQWMTDELISDFKKIYSIDLTSEKIVFTKLDTAPFQISINKSMADKMIKKYGGLEGNFAGHDFNKSDFLFTIFPLILRVLNHPSRSEFSSFFDYLYQYTFGLDDPELRDLGPFIKRGEEIFSHFNELRFQKEKILNNFMGDRLGEVFSEIIPDDLLEYSRISQHSVKRLPQEYEEMVDFSLIRIRNGKRYHPYCFEKINSSILNKVEEKPA